jgi:hypothetical protein
LPTAVTPLGSVQGEQLVHAPWVSGDYFSVGGTAGHLWHQHVTADTSPTAGSWYDWGLMGTSGTLISSPAAVSWAPGRHDLFVVDSTAQLRHAYVDSSNNSCPGPNSPCAGRVADVHDRGLLPMRLPARLGRDFDGGICDAQVAGLGAVLADPGLIARIVRLAVGPDDGYCQAA